MPELLISSTDTVVTLDTKVRDFLAAPRYAVLATVNPSGSPHLTEMWYGLKGGELFFNTTEERQKKANLERDPRVSLLVAGVKGGTVWDRTQYLRVDGRARRIATGDAARDDIVGLAIRYDGPEAEASARATYKNAHRVTYVIDVRRVYLKGL